MSTNPRMAPRPTARPAGEDRPIDDDSRPLTRVQQAVDSLGVVPVGTRVQSPKTDRKSFLLGAGEYPMPATAATVRTTVSGSGTVVTGAVSITSPVLYTGVRFTGPIAVGATGVLTLTNCETEQLITVAVGGRVLISNHVFSNVSAVNNAGGALLCYISTSQRTSGVAHTNVTVFGEVA
jgi:hypothetical protein